MRILHTESSVGWGGQEIRVLDESAGLIARGHSVAIAAPEEAQITLAAPKRNIPVFPAPIFNRNLRALRVLREVIANYRPDVIVTHSSTDSWVTAVATHFGRTVPVVRVRHLGAAVKPKATSRFIYGKVPSLVISTGTAVREMLINNLKLDPSRVVSVPSGTDTEKFSPRDRDAARRGGPFSANDRVAGIVATLRRGKGVPILLAAATRPELKDLKLLIVGDGFQLEPLKQEAAALGIASRVHFTGRQDDVTRWLNMMDVFVLPSIVDEGVPQALSQAMASGLPVITTRSGAIVEILRDEETGLFVPREDPAALASAIKRVLDDSALAKRLGKAARAQIEAGYTRKKMLDDMERLLSGVVNAKR
jgi:glycosyltransferase involved in cell wall biosynthesis